MRLLTSYVSGAFLSRWCILIGVALIASIIFLTFYRSSFNVKHYSYGSILPGSKETDFIPGDRRNLGDQQPLQKSDESKNDKTSNMEPVSVLSFAEENCPRWYDDKINVHFILHTHDDPGWLKTPDQYYVDDVHHILNAVVQHLIMEPQRKFVYSELYYFSKWWVTQREPMRSIVTRLIKEGRLEFVGGGWVQNDDASTHYTAMMDQLTYGWAKIDDFFGESALPKTGWQIDCFGLSQEQANTFEQMGMDEEVIVRLHHKDIAQRRESKQMEFLWQTSPHNNLFTHILFDHYTAPSGFQYEVAPFDSITFSNLDQKVTAFLETVRQRSNSYRTNHLLMIMGHDFVYKQANLWFDAVDLLIRNGNLRQLNGSNIQLFYSTPSCYFKAVRETANTRNVTWPTKMGDFFPYATSQGSYWTGYFSSRVHLKRVIRMANNLLLTAQNLAASVNQPAIDRYLNLSREALYVTLHHDGITGTCKQAVADEYMRYALRSIDYSQKVIQLILPSLAGRKSEAAFEFCLLSNVSICKITQESDLASIAILNGFSHDRTSFIRIPIDGKANYELVDAESNTVPFQIFPVTDEIGQFKLKGQSDAELGFFAELPALGFRIFRLKKRMLENTQDTNNQQKRTKRAEGKKSGLHSIENEYYKLDMDRSGLLAYITDKKYSGNRQRLVQSFFWYTNRDSGAYMFRPEQIIPVTNQSVTVERIEKGSLVQEIRQTFANWTTQIIRLYKGKPYVEFEWTVGPLEPEHIGKEVITRFLTDLKSEGIFYTDANGRRLMQRKRDPEDSAHPVAASYYPITAVAALRDDGSQLSIISDRALGATSIADGSLELMIHRKVLNDDGAGMGEGLNERDENNRPIVVRGKIWLTLTPIDQAEPLWRNLAKEMFYEPVVAFSRDQLEQWPNKISMLRQPVPSPVHLLTIQRMSKDVCLVRFEHFQSDDNSNSISIQFQELFRGLELESCSMTQLGGWNRNRKGHSGMTAHLRPMDILTFKCRCRSTTLFDRDDIADV